jgi:general secretion pathway protein E
LKNRRHVLWLKTTTLYAALSEINSPDENIITIEDPVEYNLTGIGQIQVNPKIGVTFAKGLRSIVRQDPDIVMVGEIRDAETAQIAVQASLTGHLVLSTVHTNSAAAAVTRLRDMGIEPFLLSSTLTAVVAQRLVRRLCEHCKTAYKPGTNELELLGLSSSEHFEFYKAHGCEKCNGNGYDGRLGIYEVIELDSKIRRMVHDNAREQDIEEVAFAKAGTLQSSGVNHVVNGLTTSEEVLRVVKQSRDSDGGV